MYVTKCRRELCATDSGWKVGMAGDERDEREREWRIMVWMDWMVDSKGESKTERREKKGERVREREKKGSNESAVGRCEGGRMQRNSEIAREEGREEEKRPL